MTDYYVGILKDISNIIYKTKQEYEKVQMNGRKFIQMIWIGMPVRRKHIID